MKAHYLPAGVTTCLAGLALLSPSQAADLTPSQSRSIGTALAREGWTSWQVEAVEGAPDSCCWSSWDHGEASRTSCSLDSERHGYGTRDGATTEVVRVYAHTEGG